MDRGTSMHKVEHGCGTALVVLGGVIVVVFAVLLLALLAHVIGLWPDWAIEAELLFKAWMKAIMK